MASAKPNTKAEKAKLSDEQFLLTLLDNLKVDHGAASKALGITKAACRMRFIRLQQKHGFKPKGKGSPRRKQAPAPIEKEANDNEATENDASKD
ncbi:hypothetical protein N7516_011293 [Penicillium verrucosum]|uniref:uncharacterized protein n=1 Tax=Penicillium verrucosum TaxID=60171 RepID=UPI002545BA66|nr:uncharacterized protein N7516_011293 [Penicillium verrucosum]KAJ5920435.1 hypothetical protein N7516_011293 [Penicillium verrucosum]